MDGIFKEKVEAFDSAEVEEWVEEAAEKAVRIWKKDRGETGLYDAAVEASEEYMDTQHKAAIIVARGIDDVFFGHVDVDEWFTVQIEDRASEILNEE